jgi:hypothetical protein
LSSAAPSQFLPNNNIPVATIFGKILIVINPIGMGCYAGTQERYLQVAELNNAE